MKDQLAQDVAALGDDAELRQILEDICALTGMGFSAIAHVTEDRWIACQVKDAIGFGLDPGEELEVRMTICDEIRQHGRAVLIDDTSRESDWWSHPVPVLYGFRSYVSLPITIDDRFFGTLCAIDPEPRSASLQEQLEALEALGRRAAARLSQPMEASPAAPPGPGAD